MNIYLECAYPMKERISITLEYEVLDAIDKELSKHQTLNRSKLIEFTLRQVFFNNKKKYYLLQKQLEEQVKKVRLINDELLLLEKHIELDKQSELLQNCPYNR